MFYEGHHAEIYDLLYAEKRYESETNFVYQQLKKYVDKVATVLETACGTGNHAFFFEQLRLKITALDVSESMVAQAQQKALERHSTIDFKVGDMRQLPTFATAFDAAVCLFNSIGYLLENQEINDFLNGVQRNLKAGGIFVFEFWHAPAMLRHSDRLKIRKFSLPDRQILRISETTLHPEHQTATVSFDIYEFFENQRFTKTTEQQTNRYFSLPEMRLFLQHNGFETLHFFAGYHANETVDEQTWNVVCVAKKLANKQN